MAGIRKFQDPYDPVESFKVRAKLSSSLMRGLLDYGKKLYERGFYFIDDKYLLGEDLMILNRSDGADSNFFVFIRKKSKNELDIFFSNPYLNKDMSKGDQILHNIIDDNQRVAEQIEDAFKKTMVMSHLKPTDQYWGAFHSHIGTINGEKVWDDGTTDSRNWILQSMLWNHDFHALTSHNWTHNEERLNFMDQRCAAGNLVLIPAWENTTTISDRVRSPHILVFCKDIPTAMKAKYEFLSKKIINNDPKKDEVTPVLSGVPGPIGQHLEYLRSLHINDEAALFIAHPSSSNSGIDILDPSVIKEVGEMQAWDLLFEFADGIEQFNFKELGTGSPSGDFINKIKHMMVNDGYLAPATHMAINWYIGELGKRNGLFVLANQDDHYQPPIDSSIFSDYSYGYNKITLTQAALDYFRKERRKPRPDEIVYGLIHKKARKEDEENSFSIEPITFTEMDENGIKLFKSREMGKLDKVRLWLKSEPDYYWNIAKLQFKYWFSSKKQKQEIKKEIAKAKAFNAKVEESNRFLSIISNRFK